MSTDPNQPSQPTTPAPGKQGADTPQAAPPTVKAPAVWVRGQEPPTQAAPAWQPPPPPPPPGPRRAPQGQRDRRDQPDEAPTATARPQAPAGQRGQEQPTRLDQAPPPTRWDRPPQRPQPQQQLQQPQQQSQQPRSWTEPQPWVEPRDNPARQSRAPGQWPQPPQPPGQQPPGQQPRLRRRLRKRRVRRSVMALFTVIVLLILLVIGDRVALAVTENQFASQIQSNGLPVKPSVSIEGFPFLTQLVAKDFHTVDISANNVPAGPVSITSINAKIRGLHFTSLSSSASARADRVDATVFVSFSALAAAGGIGNGSGITVTPAGPNTVKISANLGGVFSDSEEAQITTTGPQTISVKVLPSGGALGSLLSSFGSFSFNLPKGVPSSLRITNLDLNSQGLTVSASATNATFGK